MVTKIEQNETSKKKKTLAAIHRQHAGAKAVEEEDEKKRKSKKAVGKPQNYRPPAMAGLELAHIQSAINSLLTTVPSLGQTSMSGTKVEPPLLPGGALDLLSRSIVERDYRDGLQTAITQVLNGNLYRQLLERTTELGDRARLRSVVGRGAQRAWTVLPTCPSYVLLDIHYRLAMAYRLGLPVVLPPAKGKELCVCGYLTTDLAHAHGCPPLRASAGIPAHDAMNSLLVGQFTRAGEQVMKEVMMPSGKRMDAKVFMPHRVLNIDVSITCPAVKSYQVVASEQPMHAAHMREAYKCSKYEMEIDREGGDFVPFVLETYGAMSRTVEHVAEMIEEAAIDNCVPKPPTKQVVLNELAVQLQRGNAMCLIRALAASRQPLSPWIHN